MIENMSLLVTGLGGAPLLLNGPVKRENNNIMKTSVNEKYENGISNQQ